jgi:hypothetical protein
MRKLLVFTGLLAVSVFALTAAPVSAGSAPLTVATGSYAIVGGHGSNRTQSFTVQQSSDGTVMGQLQLNTFGGNIIHGDVNCFMRDENQAIVGGTFTKFTGNSSQVGLPFAFAIQDNPDVSTFVFYGGFDPNSSASACDQLLGTFSPPYLSIGALLNDYGVPVTTGNILIK